MKKLLLASVFAMLLPAISQAATLEFPSDAPVASITIPDSWGPKETETGIDATSDDSAIYVSIDVADAETTKKVIEDAVAFLQKNGVTIDTATEKQSEDTLNGMKMANFDWDGTDADGPVSIGLSLVSPSLEKLLIITYWGSKETQAAHREELGGIINSLKAAGAQ